MSSLVDTIHQWTVDNTNQPNMLSGPLQMSVLQLLALSLQASRILEIGMFTGYSALAMAEMLPAEGQLITLDIDEERGKIARSFFDRSPHGGKIQIMIGPALETIPRLDSPFDMAYIDADKVNYLNYYEAILPLMRSGGLIVADNVLWSASVLAPESEDAIALNEFNKRVCVDSRVHNTLLPIRDGIMVACKR